jgi:hypothetical protein
MANAAIDKLCYLNSPIAGFAIAARVGEQFLFFCNKLNLLCFCGQSMAGFAIDERKKHLSAMAGFAIVCFQISVLSMAGFAIDPYKSQGSKGKKFAPKHDPW